MDGIQILLFASVITGIGIVVFSLISMTRDNGGYTADNSYFDVDNALKALNASIEEADKATERLETFSGSVIKEIDNRYQELSHLYNLIDETKKEISTIREKDSEYAPMKPKRKASIQNPRLNEINELVAKGLTVSEIAKTLSIGQGEVKLILELGKGAN